MRGLILDFDGLVLDTESTDHAAWSRVYEEHGFVLPLDRWQAIIGTDDRGFDPCRHLAGLVGPGFDVARTQARRRALRDGLLAGLRPLPGVESWLAAARAEGLRVAIASSSDRAWVEGLLHRVGLRDHFAVLSTRDTVRAAKPDPELYLRALDALGLGPEEALAAEDSPHGVAAAKAAGLYCVAVPGPMTRGLAFPGADRVVASLAECALPELLVELRAPRAG